MNDLGDVVLFVIGWLITTTGFAFLLGWPVILISFGFFFCLVALVPSTRTRMARGYYG